MMSGARGGDTSAACIVCPDGGEAARAGACNCDRSLTLLHTRTKFEIDTAPDAVSSPVVIMCKSESIVRPSRAYRPHNFGFGLTGMESLITSLQGG